MTEAFENVNRAFSKQSVHYDEYDSRNEILKEWRVQVYHHVHQFLKPQQSILELNAGTGLDALHFASLGHSVLATDLSTGMIAEIEKKVKSNAQLHLSCRQLSYDQLHQLAGKKFNYVFSNFGGLNCISDLSQVTKHLPSLLNKGSYVTWVIMPKVCAWELTGALKGNFKTAFRRLKKNGTIAHLEGEYFPTFYHSLKEIKKAFGSSFKFIKSEGLGALSPPPHRDDLVKRNSSFYSLLKGMDSFTRHSFPFNRWADHIIVTFQYTKS
jgi:ubiquinone/menaquinone biosynthesis C-methylase UbiE